MRSKPIERKRWQFDFYNQWFDLFGPHNWYDFCVLGLDVEYAHYSKSIEVSVGLLGLNLTITYRRSFDFIDELSAKAEIIKALENEHPGAKVRDPLGLLDDLVGEEDQNND